MVERDEAPPLRDDDGKSQGWASAAASTGEWVVAAFGLVVFTTTVAVLLYQALAGVAVPPAIAIHANEITELADGYRVSFTADNTGTETAANVTVEGRLLAEAELIEASQVTLAYVPGGSSKRGGLFFTRDPRAYRLELRALGYEEP